MRWSRNSHRRTLLCLAVSKRCRLSGEGCGATCSAVSKVDSLFYTVLVRHLLLWRYLISGTSLHAGKKGSVGYCCWLLRYKANSAASLLLFLVLTFKSFAIGKIICWKIVVESCERKPDNHGRMQGLCTALQWIWTLCPLQWTMWQVIPPPLRRTQCHES